MSGDDKAPKVRVRMYRALESVADKDRTYRGLLGDCFMILLDEGNDQARILIDCGMLLGSPNAQARMQAIAADIVESCGGDLAKGRPGKLDLLVVTHEHWDHISGFSQAQNVFFDPTKLEIANIWMGWTEKPDDPQAQALRKRFDKSGAAFAMIAKRLDEDRARFGADAKHRALQGLEGFLGAAAESEAGKAPAKLAGRDILEKLKDLRKGKPDEKDSLRFLEPGTVLPTPGAVSLPAFVLGPPRDEKRLFNDKPSTKTPETYFDGAAGDGAQMLKFGEGGEPDPSRDSPFAPAYCKIAAPQVSAAPADDASEDKGRVWLRTRYYGSEHASPAARAALARRRIDTEWLGAAGGLALKLDSDTNNTSLVLAFELRDGTTMLFAADAQVGNWLSWHDQTYKAAEGAELTAEQLLNRVRLYKVGHHGSHNATLHERGLALMTRDDLVALIPTDEVLGKAQGGGWQMPNPRVRTALLEATKGRILRNDRRYWLDDPAERQKDPELKDVEPGFFTQLEETDLYLEYRLP